MPEAVSAMIALFWVISALAAFSVWWPQTKAMVRLASGGDGYQLFRLKDFLIMGVVLVGTGWRAVTWLDYTFNNQEFFGTVDRRWPFEFFVAFALMVAALYFAWLYHRTEHTPPGVESDRHRNSQLSCVRRDCPCGASSRGGC